jgi:iron complex outermembrane receptor protein
MDFLGGDFEDPYTYYQDDAEKRDWNLFGRTNMKVTQQFDITVDLQGRWIKYQFNGPDVGGNINDQEVIHAFFQSKLGLTYSTL